MEGCNLIFFFLISSMMIRFNTENGMWRAAIVITYNVGKAFSQFQYRERYVEGCNDQPESLDDFRSDCFNTENGMWRAAIKEYLK